MLVGIPLSTRFVSYSMSDSFLLGSTISGASNTDDNELRLSALIPI